MITYRRAESEEIPQILDFINMVFSMEHSPHNFREMLPKLYQQGNEEKSRHYIAVEDGMIKAVVCAAPITFHFQGKSLTCAGIGSVSVHPYFRGNGYMRQLMHMALSEMKAENVSMSLLSGRRHRYQYYGYEKGGLRYTYRFIKDAFRHCRKNFPDKKLTAVRIDSQDDQYISLIHSLYEQRTVRCGRSFQDFYSICQSWGHQLYAVFHDYSFCGYFSMSGNVVQEIGLVDPQDLFSCLECCQKCSQKDTLYLDLLPWENEYMLAIAGLYESCSISIDDNYQIFDYPKVLEFFLQIQAGIQKLEDGTLDFCVKDAGNFRISVEQGIPAVTVLEETSSLVLTPNQVISCMFSPDPVLRLHMLPKNYNWFPLPLSLCVLDKC